MRAVFDTNVFVSGVFFGGPPHKILQAWRDRKVALVISGDILDEYRRVGERLAVKFPGVKLNPFLALVLAEAEIVAAPPLPHPVCQDPDDDKFLACAVAGRCKLIVSGDRQLLMASGYRGIRVLRPRLFVDQYL